jgi:hypothetical protein
MYSTLGVGSRPTAQATTEMTWVSCERVDLLEYEQVWKSPCEDYVSDNGLSLGSGINREHKTSTQIVGADRRCWGMACRR